MNVRLATRTSALALYQAEAVTTALQRAFPGLTTEVVGISTKGDQDQQTALQHLGQTGIFTKAVDDAVLEGRADVGVHSLKDYPTQMPQGLQLLAVLPRDGMFDVFVPGREWGGFEAPAHLLSGSPRRKAQWWARFPQHSFGELRGNMDTRLAKMLAGGGGIVSGPGLKRLGMLPENAQELDWMVPAPGQGVMAVVGRADDAKLAATFAAINHLDTYRCSYIERQFMAEVEAGCASPLGALAVPYHDRIRFHGILLSLDGREQVEVKEEFRAELWPEMGKKLAQKLLEKGGRPIMEAIRAVQPKDVLFLKPISPETRRAALELGWKLHDVEVVRRAPVDFGPVAADVVAVAGAYGAQLLVDRLEALPSVIWTVGARAVEVLKGAGFRGVLRKFDHAEELVAKWHELGRPELVFCGAERSTLNWQGAGMQHLITYTNTPAHPRLARQNWDAVAAFSPLGVESLLAHNPIDLGTPVVAIGPTTAKACEEAGFTHIFTAAEASVQGVLNTLATLNS